jgi:beta-barrel assembly-enhancing protease
MTKKYFYSLLTLMVGCGTAVSLGQQDTNVSFDSAREIWSDVLRDVDEFGLHATRIPAEQEMQLGASIANEVKVWGPEDAEASKYVAAVGAALLPGVNRKPIRYQFHVVQSPAINAFALPGGHVYVMSGMMEMLESEAELAAVLGHEISHVDLRHCVERYQYEIAMKNVGAGDGAALVGIAHQLVAIGYTQFQESEADAGGERLAIDAGYDPDAAARVFERMKVRLGEGSAEPATTPLGEVSQAMAQALGAYFQTHPPSADRARQMQAMTARNRTELAGRVIYMGVRNYKERTPRSAAEFAEEKHVY